MGYMKPAASWAQDATGWLLRLLLHDGVRDMLRIDDPDSLRRWSVNVFGDVFGSCLNSWQKEGMGRIWSSEGVTRRSRWIVSVEGVVWRKEGRKVL